MQKGKTGNASGIRIIRLAGAAGKSTQNISRKDRGKAEKYLEQHSEHELTAYPDALAIRLKVNAIQQKFAETYKHEPVLEYFENFTEIDVCQSALNGNVLLWKLSTEETQKKLAKLYRRQYELEKYILEGHKKNSYPE